MPGLLVVRFAMFALLFSVAGCAPDTPDAELDTERATELDSASGRACIDSLGNGEWLLVASQQEKPLLLCGKAVARALLLARLADALAFEVRHPNRVAGEFNGWITGETPEQLLLQLLRGQAISFNYEPNGDTHRLMQLTIAKPSTTPEYPVISPVAYGIAVVDETAVDEQLLPVAESSEPFDAALLARWQSDYAHVASLLSHPDAAVRLQGIDELAAEGAGLQVLDRALATERDSMVRIELLRKLNESGSVIALQSMLRALGDSEAEVVVESIQLVADWHDVEVIERYVQPLLTHASNDVREAAKTAIDRFR